MKFKHLLLIAVVLLTLVLLVSCLGKKYTVVFDSNGGTEVESQTVKANSMAITPRTPQKEGYKFAGWYADDEKWLFARYPVTGNMVLEAKWEPITYTVTFDTNGGVEGTTISVAHGSKLTASFPSRANYTLDGWYVGDKKWNFSTDTVSSDMTLVAKWVPMEKTVEFDATGGTVDEASRKVTYGEEIGKLPIPVYKGYVFVGWYDARDLDFETLITSTTVVTGNHHFVAKWELAPKEEAPSDGENTDTVFTVIFDANGGVRSEVITVTSGSTILPISVTKEGYTFLGWYLNDTLWNFETDTVKGNITLVAHWKLEPFTVTFDSDGGTSVEPQLVEKGSPIVAPENPTKEGYTFLGWYVGDEKWSFIGYVVTGNITLTAKWEINTYTVTFDANGGVGGESITATYGSKISPISVTKEGYTFLDWYLDGTKWDFEADTVKGNITLTAKWEINTYTVTFDANGGTNGKSITATHGSTVSSVSTAKDGHTFLGWYLNGTKWDFEADTVKENITLTAKWEINTYTITFDANGGTNGKSITATYGSIISSISTAKEGYTLLGWYLNGTKWDFESDTVKDNITLTAKWEINTYTVTFDANGGTNGKTISVTHGSTISNQDTQKDNYVLIGWYADGEKWDFENDTVKDNITLTAKWEGKPISVSFDGDFSHLKIDDVTVKYGDTLDSLPTLVEKGYEFIGWYFEGEPFDISTVITKPITLVARWNRILLCSDGTTNHNWSYSHQYLMSVAVCTICQTSDYITYENITASALGGRYPIVDGEAWGTNNVANLVNGIIESNNSATISGKGTSALTVTLTFNNPQIADIIFVSGSGSSVYTVTAVYQDGSESLLGSGTFGSYGGYEAEDKAIVKLIVNMPNPSNGYDYWQEIALLKRNESYGVHVWSEWENEYLNLSRTHSCYICGKVETEYFDNITTEALGDGVYPTIDGEGWGKNNVANLVNGIFDETTSSVFAGKGTTPITVTLNLTNPTAIDMIYVKGRGSASIEVTVIYEDGTSKMIGVGSFGDKVSAFDVGGRVIKKVIVYMPNPSIGTDYWEEIALCTKKEIPDGHLWSEWENEYLSRSRACYLCGDVEVEAFENITIDALGNGVYPTIDGDGWGKNNVANLVNGIFDETTSSVFAGNGTTPITVTLNLTNPTAIDVIYVKGRGYSAFEVTVIYTDGTSKMIGVGSFGDKISAFDVGGKVIKKVVVYMPNSSSGSDYWEEIALCTKKESTDEHLWSEWENEYLIRTRVCYLCGEIETEHFENITTEALGPGVYPIFDGDAYGKNNVSNLINGTIEPSNVGTIAGKGTGAVTVILNLTNPTAVDMIYVKGKGTATIEVTVTYEDGTTKMLGVGAFTSDWVGNTAAKFEVEGKVITKVVINMPNPSIAEDFWQEIALCTKTESTTAVCEHDYQPTNTDNWISVSCIKNGMEYYSCTKCGIKTMSAISALGHNIVKSSTEPTCLNAGYIEQYCINKGCSFSVNIPTLPATGLHNFDADGDGYVDYEYIIIPTDYTPGIEMIKCSVCSYSEEYFVDALLVDTNIIQSLPIDNYLYKNETPFHNISSFGGASVSSYYTICVGSNINDGSYETYWGADTLADGSTYTGDTATITFNKYFEIGAVRMFVPFYSSWGLGDSCYVSYDIEALVMDGNLEKWIKIGEMSDKDATLSGINGVITLELANTINAKAIRARVTHSTRYANAIIYEMEIFANVDSKRAVGNLLDNVSASVSGKYNAYAGGAENLVDGDMSSAWHTDWRNTNNSYAILELPETRFLSAVQFAIYATSGRTVSLSIWVEDESYDDGGYWETVGEYSVPNKLNNTDEMQVIKAGSNTACLFTVKLEKRTSKLKLQFVKEPQYWTSYVYCFEPYTVYETAVNIDSYEGCIHKNFVAIANGTVEPTCMDAGYTVYECLSCRYQIKTDATHALGHSFGEYEKNATTLSTNGCLTETAICTRGCGASRTRSYTETYKAAVVTKYYKNAPAAWVQTYDDGNYIDTYLWAREQFEKYHYRATASISITFASEYVSQWQELFSSGAFDLGSHSYNHMGIYSGQISESSMLSDVDRAHYWFMHNFQGQKILTFATPNGSTSSPTAEYITHLMVAGRNGGAGGYINYIDSLNFGSLNCYASKAGETEGDFVLIKDGSTGGTYKPVYDVTVDEETGEETKTLTGFEWTTVGSYTSASFNSYTESSSGEYILIHNIAANGTFTGSNIGGDYKFIKKSTLGVNYVYSEAEGTLVNVGTVNGSYYYDDENYQMKWVEGGSYDFNPNTRTYTFKEDGTGAYRLNHTAKGSYEKVIDELLSKGAFTVECVHALQPNTHYLGGMIHSSYVSTMSKFDYLKKQGLWVCSFTDITQYLKESLSAHVTTKEITDTSITLTLTDTMEDYMFDHPLTIKVDIPNDWKSVKVMQGGKEIKLVSNFEYSDDMTAAGCTIKDGYLYVDAIPDRGDIVITRAEN